MQIPVRNSAQRCDFRPVTTSAEKCLDCPRGTLKDCHFPDEINVKCFAKNKICPMWCE